MTVRLAFAGFRHGHVVELYRMARGRDDVRIVAAAEEHEPTRAELADADAVRITHDSYDELFAGVEFDALAVGDYYARRGAILIRALEAGKHVISDKPICTDPAELERIAELARAGGLSVGCQLGIRDSGNFIALRELIAAGRIGQVHTICFSGQHPLLRGSRPAWYFEPGKHGGTINDIAIHAIAAIPWLTGRRIVEVVAVRAWNGGITEPDWFQVGGQMMLRLDNDGGVLGDVSYLAPTRCGYRVNSYWRVLVHGDAGQAETATTINGVTLYTDDAADVEHVPPAPSRTGGYLDSFLGELTGRSEGLSLTTPEVLEAARITLAIQRAADEGRHSVPLG